MRRSASCLTRSGLVSGWRKPIRTVPSPISSSSLPPPGAWLGSRTLSTACALPNSSPRARDDLGARLLVVGVRALRRLPGARLDHDLEPPFCQLRGNGGHERDPALAWDDLSWHADPQGGADSIRHRRPRARPLDTFTPYGGANGPAAALAGGSGGVALRCGRLGRRGVCRSGVHRRLGPTRSRLPDGPGTGSPSLLPGSL